MTNKEKLEKEIAEFIEKTYWNGNGKYQKEYEILVKLIPEKGRSKFENIELLRCISNIYYDYYNNGFCNYNILKEEIAFLERHGFIIRQDITPEELESIINAIVERILGKPIIG